MYERTLLDEPRTTNYLEGWRRRINSIVGKAHPNIWDFLKCLLGEQAHIEMAVNAANFGASNSMQPMKTGSTGRTTKEGCERVRRPHG